jgi:PST family polysaccharide transporter
MAAGPAAVSADSKSADSTPDSSLGRRAARGGVVVLGGQAARIVLQMGSMVVLARLLGPFDFGLVASAMVVIGFGEIFRDFGLSTAAVQARTLSVAQRDTLWWLNTAIGAGLTALCVAAAPLVAAAFGKPELRGIVMWLALTFLLNGMTAQYRADLNRRMRFTPLVLVDVAGQFVGTVLVIALAAGGAGYWSLVAQQLSTAVVVLCAYIVVARWLPLRPSRSAGVRSFVRFGIGLVGSQLVTYLNSNIDNLVIGLRMGTTPLGLYSRGYQLVMRPLGQLRAPTTTVALPVLSRLQGDTDRAGRFLVRGQRALCYPLVTLMAVMAGTAGPFVTLALGAKWSATAPVVAFLAVAGGFQTLAYVGSWVYLSRGLTKQLFWYSLAMCVLTVTCVLVGSTWGITGVAAGFAAAFSIEWQISQWYLARLTPIPLRSLYLGAWRVIAVTSLGGGAAFGASTILADAADLVRVSAGIVAMAAAYALVAMVVPAVRRDLRDVGSVLLRAVRR